MFIGVLSAIWCFNSCEPLSQIGYAHEVEKIDVSLVCGSKVVYRKALFSQAVMLVVTIPGSNICCLVWSRSKSRPSKVYSSIDGSIVGTLLNRKLSVCKTNYFKLFLLFSTASTRPKEMLFEKLSRSTSVTDPFVLNAIYASITRPDSFPSLDSSSNRLFWTTIEKVEISTTLNMPSV